MIAALENVKLAQAESRGSKDIRRVREKLARAVDRLPRLPDFDMPLGYVVSGDVRVELRVNNEHPAYVAAQERRSAFTGPDKQLLVEEAFNYVSLMPQHGIMLKRRLSSQRPPGREPLSPRVRSEVLHRDNYTCQYCGRKAPTVVLEVDHRVPVSGGGTDESSNLITACTDCNRGKSNRFAT